MSCAPHAWTNRKKQQQHHRHHKGANPNRERPVLAQKLKLAGVFPALPSPLTNYNRTLLLPETFNGSSVADRHRIKAFKKKKRKEGRKWKEHSAELIRLCRDSFPPSGSPPLPLLPLPFHLRSLSLHATPAPSPRRNFRVRPRRRGRGKRFTEALSARHRCGHSVGPLTSGRGAPLTG